MTGGGGEEQGSSQSKWKISREFTTLNFAQCYEGLHGLRGLSNLLVSNFG